MQLRTISAPSCGSLGPFHSLPFSLFSFGPIRFQSLLSFSKSTMKLLVIVLGFVTVQSFVPFQRKIAATQLQMGLLDKLFKPIHGHGSGEKELDEIFKGEQDLLRERKTHYKKSQLKKKYAPKKNWIEQMISEPIHGHGSGENEMDKMYKEQQKILYKRREYYGNKNMLKKKYKNTGVDHLSEIKTINANPADLNKREDDAMYVGEDTGFQFPWINKLKP